MIRRALTRETRWRHNCFPTFPIWSYFRKITFEKYNQFDLDDLWSLNHWPHLKFEEKRYRGYCFFLIWFIHHSSWSWWQNHDTSRNIMRITDKQGQIQGWLLGSKPLADRKTASSAGGGGRCFERICICKSFQHPSSYNTLVIILSTYTLGIHSDALKNVVPPSEIRVPPSEVMLPRSEVMMPPSEAMEPPSELIVPSSAGKICRPWAGGPTQWKSYTRPCG